MSGTKEEMTHLNDESNDSANIPGFHAYFDGELNNLATTTDIEEFLCNHDEPESNLVQIRNYLKSINEETGHDSDPEDYDNSDFDSDELDEFMANMDEMDEGERERFQAKKMKFYKLAVEDCKSLLESNENLLKARLLLAKFYYKLGDMENHNKTVEEMFAKNAKDREYIEEYVKKIRAPKHEIIDEDF